MFSCPPGRTRWGAQSLRQTSVFELNSTSGDGPDAAIAEIIDNARRNVAGLMRLSERCEIVVLGLVYCMEPEDAPQAVHFASSTIELLTALGAVVQFSISGTD